MLLLLLLSLGAAAGGSALRRRGEGLRALPPLPAALQDLDVSDNNITSLPPDALLAAPDLRELNLSLNPLQELSLSSRRLARLWAARCRLRLAPRLAAPALRYLSLADNELEELEDGALQLPALHTLILKRNRISYISDKAFAGTPALRVLRLEENQLSEAPAALQLLPSLEDLSLAHNRIWSLGPGALSAGGGAGGAGGAGAALVRLDLGGNPLSRLHPAALDHLPRLVSLSLSGCRALGSLPALAGAARLRLLRADRAALPAAAATDVARLCRHAPALRTLDLKSNFLEEIPDLEACTELRVLELSYNRVASLSGLHARRLHDLLLAGNRLRAVPAAAFRRAPRLQLLDLEDNEIEHIDIEAFLPIEKLEDLNVGNNRFPSLPAGGLQWLRHLKAHNNPRLKHFHPPQLLPRIQTLVLSYAYHCCEYLPAWEGGSLGAAGAGAGAGDAGGAGLTDLVLVPPPRADLAAWANATDLYTHYLNATGQSAAELREALAAWSKEWGARGGRGARSAGQSMVQCLPMPGPFLPCVDLFDWWSLRCGVWAVLLLALLGNGTVVLVLLVSRARLDVPRFLVANLAAADFCMGLYLGVLAVVDAGTLGEFRARALAWQLSGACRAAGFLAVLSAELSVYTLAVITLERNYAITHAMHLNKRLSLRHAAGVMAAGWLLALGAAALPLLGVSDYRKFAVCLPFETSTPGALAYVLALLAANGVAFLVLLGCYLKMYCAIRGSQAWNSNDSRIAKRMALLVFTDFLCWSPIAVCALTAALGAPLVGLEAAKVFTVFVLPLNSCCNPFLYAILTKQFKKDCTLVCKAIEESRVTRGIGRCRHSSNFSNRQTPANTNSLGERSSRGHAPSCACRRLLAPPPPPAPRAARLLAWLRAAARRAPPAPPARAPAPPAPRAGSVSSSVEFSSSRSDSWRAYGGRPPPPRRAASWLVARKTSQDSNLSSSRNDSSGSAATASTGTWRTSRSAGSAAGAAGAGGAGGAGAARPRLTRQPAVLGEEPPGSPPPRTLTTIPSAAEPDAPPDALLD